MLIFRFFSFCVKLNPEVHRNPFDAHNCLAGIMLAVSFSDIIVAVICSIPKACNHPLTLWSSELRSISLIIV